MARSVLIVASLLLVACDRGVVTERGAFLVDLGLQMEKGREVSPLAVAQGSGVCPEVVAQVVDDTFQSTSGSCLVVGKGCEVLEVPGVVDYVVQNVGGCESPLPSDTFSVDVVPWSDLDVHLESPFDAVFSEALRDAEGAPLELPPLHEGGVVTVVEGGVVTVRGVPRRGDAFVAYDADMVRMNVGAVASDGSTAVSAEDVGPLEVVTPDGPRALGQLVSASVDDVVSLELIAGWVEDSELGVLYVPALRLVARDASGNVLHGAPVRWRVPEGDDVALAQSAVASDYVEVSGSCDGYRARAGVRHSVVQATLGEVDVTLPIQWRDPAYLGDASDWRPNEDCMASEVRSETGMGCSCNEGSADGLGWMGAGILLVFLRRSRRDAGAHP